MTESSQPPEDEAVKVTPFKLIRRGDDTIDHEEDITFADFSPRILPADAPDENDLVVPKDGSVPEPVPSPESPPIVTHETSGTDALSPAAKAAGKPSPRETGKPDSSSPKKSG